jgi:hypothetical protein
LRPTIHEIITSKIKSHAELINSSRSGIGQGDRTATAGLHLMKGQLQSFQLQKQKRQNGIYLVGTLSAVSPVSAVMAPTGKAQAAAMELLDSILDAVVRIFGALPIFYVLLSLSIFKLNFSILPFRESCCCWRDSGIKIHSSIGNEHTKVIASRLEP